MDIQEAKLLGLKRYTGKACIACGNTERYVRNLECTACRHNSNLARAKKIRAERGLKKAGRPRLEKPLRKKHDPKPITDFDNWMRRSRRGKNYPLRKNLTYRMYMNLYVTHCPLLGLELTYAKYEGNTPDNYASLDKIDPSKGYVEGNVQILSFRANTIKGHATLEELKLIVANWTKQNNKNP